MVSGTTETKSRTEAFITRIIIYVGLMSIIPSTTGSALDKGSGKVIDFRCWPTLKDLLGQLSKLDKHYPRCLLKLCYEARYIDYTQHRG